MPDQVYVFQVSTPAGTPASAPILTSCTMPPCLVRRITVKVPPGPAGHLRFQIAVNGTSYIPANGTSYIQTDGDNFSFDIFDAVESGKWQVKSYNTGIYAHAIELRFEVDLPSRRAAPARAPLATITGAI